MAEQQAQEKKPKKVEKEEEYESLVRIFSYDLPGSRSLYVGLTRIKGVSWAISNAVCISSKIPHSKKISSLSPEEKKKVEEALRHLKVPHYMKNRRSDLETGDTGHFYGTDLDFKREFDIKRLRKIRSYRGIRHGLGQPSRGQRTRSHFRTKGKAVGVKRSSNAKKK